MNLIFHTMTRFLKPKDLETSPNDPEAAAAVKYWLGTFETFLQTVEAGQAATNIGIAVNKKGLIVKFLSPAVYSYTYKTVRHTTRLYLHLSVCAPYANSKNDVFTRHLLATRKQQTAESLQ